MLASTYLTPSCFCKLANVSKAMRKAVNDESKEQASIVLLHDRRISSIKWSKLSDDENNDAKYDRNAEFMCLKALEDNIKATVAHLEKTFKVWRREEKDRHSCAGIMAKDVITAINDTCVLWRENPYGLAYVLKACTAHVSTLGVSAILLGVRRALDSEGDDDQPQYKHLLLRAFYSKCMSQVSAMTLQVCYSQWGSHNPLGFRLRDVPTRKPFSLLQDVCTPLESKLSLVGSGEGDQDNLCPSDAHSDADSSPMAVEGGGHLPTSAHDSSLTDMWIEDPNAFTTAEAPEPRLDFLDCVEAVVKRYDATNMLCLKPPFISVV